MCIYVYGHGLLFPAKGSRDVMTWRDGDDDAQASRRGGKGKVYEMRNIIRGGVYPLGPEAWG